VCLAVGFSNINDLKVNYSSSKLSIRLIDFRLCKCGNKSTHFQRTFTTPAKIFIHRLANAIEEFQADLGFQKKQYDELHTIITIRIGAQAYKKTVARRAAFDHSTGICR
jgi:hypothetical protein